MDSTLNNIRTESLYRKLIRIALPISVQGVISATLGLVDNIMVGALGETALAAVGIALQVFFVHYLILFGFTSGCATFVAQFFGADDEPNIRKTVGFAMTAAMAVGLVFFVAVIVFPEQIIRFYSNDKAIIPDAVNYMRIGSITMIFLAITIPFESALKATQQTKIPLVASAIAFSMNTLLNYIFIFGKFGLPEMGVSGAALATVFSRFIEMTIIIMAIRRGNALKGKLTDYFGWSKDFVKRVMRNARVTTVNELLWSLGQTVYVSAYARIGITAYAAYQAATNINSIFYFAAFSIGDAALILIGQYLGEGKLSESYDLAKKLLKISFVVGILAGLLVLSSLPVLKLYSFTPLGLSYGRKLLMIFAGTMVMNLLNSTLVVGVLRAGGDTFYAMVAECSSVWFIGVPIAFIAALWLQVPIYIAVLMMQLSEVFKLCLLIYRFMSKKWIKNVIEGL